jgi:hypothetical protein
MDGKHVAELIGTAFELAGVAVLVIGAILSFTWYVVSLIRFRDGPACFGYFRHPFEKLTAWSFTIFLFFFVM